MKHAMMSELNISIWADRSLHKWSEHLLYITLYISFTAIKWDSPLWECSKKGCASHKTILPRGSGIVLLITDSPTTLTSLCSCFIRLGHPIMYLLWRNLSIKFQSMIDPFPTQSYYKYFASRCSKVLNCYTYGRNAQIIILRTISSIWRKKISL